MSKKWEKFYSSYSPVTIDKPNTKDANLVLDWKRESGQNRMLINGIPLSVYATKYNGFSNIEDVRKFFSEVILKDMKSISSSQKENIISYLETAFHQGGLMYPVSAAFSVSMKECHEDLDLYEPYATVGDMDMKINIQTTPNGFKVQEITGVKFLLATPGASLEKMANEDFQISPDIGNDYIVKLQGTLDVDFAKNSSSPKISVESNTISYGNSAIQQRVDNRSLGKMIVDFFKNIMGLNQVQDLSDKYAEKNQQEQKAYVEEDILPSTNSL